MRIGVGNEGRGVISKNVKLIHTPSSEWKGRKMGEGGEGKGV